MFLLTWNITAVLAVLFKAGVGLSNSGRLYRLVCRPDEYEVRRYSPSRWVSTDAESYLMGVGAAMAFRRLHQYISGANRAGVSMEMTAPVLVLVPEETPPWEPALYTLSFLLPPAYQKRPPPAPTNEKVYFTEMPETSVYVRTFGGWMLSLGSQFHRLMLIKELEGVGAQYNRTYHYTVGYDSPLKLLNRRNELWYVVEGKPVCNSAATANATATSDGAEGAVSLVRTGPKPAQPTAF